MILPEISDFLGYPFLNHRSFIDPRHEQLVGEYFTLRNDRFLDPFSGNISWILGILPIFGYFTTFETFLTYRTGGWANPYGPWRFSTPENGKIHDYYPSKRCLQRVSESVKKWSCRGLAHSFRHRKTEKSHELVTVSAKQWKVMKLVLFHVFGSADKSVILVLIWEPFCQEVSILARIITVLWLFYPLLVH